MKRTIRLKESELRRMISESVKRALRESDELPYLSDQDIHKQYEGFEIDEFTIKPKKFRYGGGYGWEIGFAIHFPNVDHPDFDESRWENVDVWDEDGKRITWDGWYPEDISQQLISMIRSEIQKHMREMQEFKEQTNQGFANETLNRIVNKTVKRVLRETDNDYEGNDLDYDSIQMQAMSVIPRMHQNGQDVSWRSVAKEMGFRLETLNGEDMELLKDAIEDTMMEDENPYYREDADFENDFQNLPYTNETLNRIVNESVKSVLRESEENFADKYNAARQNYNKPLWGFEMKNQEGEWQYGDIEYDPNTQTMSCMGVSIEVDPSLSVDQNLEGLYEELMNNGFTEGE